MLLEAAAAWGEKHKREVPPECFHHKEGDQPSNPDVNCAVTNTEGLTILISTLEGGLFAVDKKTGSIRWKLIDEPVVKSPYNPAKPVLPAFLPDPKDGTLYMMGSSMTEPLKKFPFTIPELVAASPSKSAEGILYSGKKVDTWFSVDKSTGKKFGSLNYLGCMLGEDDTCPAKKAGTFLIGRTEYNVMMYDTRTPDRKWNITYYDYAANMADSEAVTDYELAHFSDSSTGLLMTLDRMSGELAWESSLDSPVVAMYQLDGGDNIQPVPFTSVSIETLHNLIQNSDITGNQEKLGETKLFPTLYVGEHKHGLFAVPSLVDKQTMRISPSNRNEPLLLEGEVNVSQDEYELGEIESEDKYSQHINSRIPSDRTSMFMFGHYKLTESKDSRPLMMTGPLLLTSTSSGLTGGAGGRGGGESVKLISALPTHSNQSKPQLRRLHHGFRQILQLNTSFILSADLPLFFKDEVYPHTLHILEQIENKELKLILLIVFFTVVWVVRSFKHQVSIWQRMQSSNSRSYSQGSVGSTSQYEVTATPVELSTGEIKVGNVSFHPDKVLGKGCEGTFVYQGKFDNRDVAVKRVLAACFSIADREVDLLRESDEHPNVIRYFCMEQCRQFRYIALELCAATLQEYIDGKYKSEKLEMTSIFRQSVQGLAHLHNLDIAHRDIKPANVLISWPGKQGEVRAMISDFGLCKKLKLGRMSFSQRSGVAGTEGWIAPEMLLGHGSTTCKVDIFSLGCVYYSCLTGGKHPFGDTFHRQAGILSGRYDLDGVEQDETNALKVSLIEKMLSFDPTDRPPAAAILKHPVFWTKEKMLTYLQEVSDRTDKEDEDTVLMIRLESGAEAILNKDWLATLHPVIREDLCKQRTYRNTVKDLLRALRNKKHHYRELRDAVKQIYGPMPNQFTHFWISRFPLLVNHVYNALQCIKYETNFAKFYHKDYDFVKKRIGSRDPSMTAAQRDLFDGRSDHGDTTSTPNSLVSNWEDLHSDKFQRDPSSSWKLYPSNAPPTPQQDSARSLLGFVQSEENKEQVKENSNNGTIKRTVSQK